MSFDYFHLANMLKIFAVGTILPCQPTYLGLHHLYMTYIYILSLSTSLDNRFENVSLDLRGSLDHPNPHIQVGYFRWNGLKVLNYIHYFFWLYPE